MKNIELARKDMYVTVQKEGKTFLLTVEELVSFFENSKEENSKTEIAKQVIKEAGCSVLDLNLSVLESVESVDFLRYNIKMVKFLNHSDIPKDFTGICQVTKSGTILHFKNGKRHNENGPAVILSDESEFWYINDLCHREDGAACEYEGGGKHWCYKDKIYGYDNDFTNETWVEKVAELKSQGI